MSALDSYILNSDRIAPTADSNMQLRRLLWHMANLNASGLSSGSLSIKDPITGLIARVLNTDPVGTEEALVVRPIGAISITGSALVEGVQADDVAVSGNDPVLTGGVTADPSSLPANTVTGRVKRFLTNLKGIQLVHQANTIHTSDTMGVMRKATEVDAGYLRGSSTALSNTAVAIKASAGNLYSLTAYNPSATDAAWLCVYDTAAASVTVGTTALAMKKILVPPLSQYREEFEYVHSHTTAISIAAVKLYAENDATAPSTALVVGWGYK